MDNDEREADLSHRIDEALLTLEMLHRRLRNTERTIRQMDLNDHYFNQLKNEYNRQIENIDERVENLRTDEASELTTRENTIRQIEQELLDLEDIINQIPERVRSYQPEEEPEPDEDEEQLGGGRRKHRKTKHRKTKHKGGKRKQKTRRNKRKRTRRNKH